MSHFTELFRALHREARLPLPRSVTSPSAIKTSLQAPHGSGQQPTTVVRIATPRIHQQIPQFQAGLTPLRQGLECVEDALIGLSADPSTCPLCGNTLISASKPEMAGGSADA